VEDRAAQGKGDLMDTLSETLADFRRELAGFTLQRPAVNSNSLRYDLKELSTELGDFVRDLAISNSNSARRVRAMEIKRFSTALEQMSKELTDIRLSPFPPNSLLEIKRSPGGAIKSYASTFGTRDLQNEIMDPGAFGASLAKHRRNGTQPLLLWQHNTDDVIGVWENLSEDAKGLLAIGRLLPSVQRGSEAIDLLDAGANLGLSVGFLTLKDKIINKTRHLQEVDLLEISIVSFPSTPGTSLQIAGKEYSQRSEAKTLVDFNRALSDFSMERV
jgi:HK97 family phage prohead protease